MKCDYCDEDCGVNTVDGWYCFECNGISGDSDPNCPDPGDDDYEPCED